MAESTGVSHSTGSDELPLVAGSSDTPDISELGGLEPQGASPVELEEVTKRFGDVVAVNSVSLRARAGELLVLLGPSGCGKSTVLRIVAGLEEPDTGTVRIGDTVMNGVDPARRDIAMVFQSYALYPHMTVRRNIEFPLRARHIEDSERNRLVREIARSLQLEAMLERKPAQLSGGQRQRVALARAIVRRPRVFLMDEPLSNLDAQLRLEMRAELVELHARLGTTLVYVTHDQTEAMTMGSRIAVMDRGVLQQLGTPDEVHDHPKNAFVAGFIGFPPMNIVPARLLEPTTAGPTTAQTGGQETVGGLDAVVRGGAIAVPGTLAGAARRLGLLEVLVGARPDSLRISTDGTVDATVSLVESFGREHHAACRLPGGQLVTVRIDDSLPRPRTGDAVKIKVVGPLHLFDSSTGERITGA
jgi:ABC-type sugar transport system ATPase subunit